MPLRVAQVSLVGRASEGAHFTVTFDRPGVGVAAGAFELSRDGNTFANVFASPGSGGATSTYVLTFFGPRVDGRLPEGNYDLRVVAGLVTSANGHQLEQDHVHSFFVLHGDVNLDRTVNGTDFAILAGNFGKTGQTYAAGDLNGDGSVNGGDFAILAANFGRSLPPPPAPPIVAAVGSAPSTSAFTTPARTKLTRALKELKRMERAHQEK